MPLTLEQEKEMERKALICELSPAGFWVLNKPKLAKVLETEGFSFKDETATDIFAEFGQCVWCQNDECSKAHMKKTVYLLTTAQIRKLKPGAKLERLLFTLGWLFLPDEIRENTIFQLRRFTSQYEIPKWIREDGDNCAICYEPLYTGSLARTSEKCICATEVCFGCSIDMLSMADTEMTRFCPNCRCESDPFDSFQLITFEIEFNYLRRGLHLKEMGDERLDFIEKMTSVDLTLPRARVRKQMDVINKTFGSVVNLSGYCPPEIKKEWYKDTIETVARIRKKKVARASADSSSAVAVRSKGGCANCGKRFWDKSEWRRAPKCTKCRRTAYCCAKCRKKHRKTHAGECSAKGPKKKCKPKRKPKTGKCSP